MIAALQAAVRPVVTLLVTLVLCYGFLTDKIGAEAFLGVVSMVVTFWFSQRERAKAETPPGPSGP